MLAIQFLWWGIVLLYIYRLVTVKYQLPFAEAAHDVDQPSDLEFVRGLLEKRERPAP